MAHPKKLVVSDVDGTILTSTGEIDPMTVEGIEKLQRLDTSFPWRALGLRGVSKPLQATCVWSVRALPSSRSMGR